jgi:hypothetical protein
MKEGFYINQTIVDLVQYFKFNKAAKERAHCTDITERGHFNVKTFCQGTDDVRIYDELTETVDLPMILLTVSRSEVVEDDVDGGSDAEKNDSGLGSNAEKNEGGLGEEGTDGEEGTGGVDASDAPDASSYYKATFSPPHLTSKPLSSTTFYFKYDSPLNTLALIPKKELFPHIIEQTNAYTDVEKQENGDIKITLSPLHPYAIHDYILFNQPPTAVLVDMRAATALSRRPLIVENDCYKVLAIDIVDPKTITIRATTDLPPSLSGDDGTSALHEFNTNTAQEYYSFTSVSGVPLQPKTTSSAQDDPTVVSGVRVKMGITYTHGIPGSLPISNNGSRHFDQPANTITPHPDYTIFKEDDVILAKCDQSVDRFIPIKMQEPSVTGKDTYPNGHFKRYTSSSNTRFQDISNVYIEKFSSAPHIIAPTTDEDSGSVTNDYFKDDGTLDKTKSLIALENEFINIQQKPGSVADRAFNTLVDKIDTAGRDSVATESVVHTILERIRSCPSEGDRVYVWISYIDLKTDRLGDPEQKDVASRADMCKCIEVVLQDYYRNLNASSLLSQQDCADNALLGHVISDGDILPIITRDEARSTMKGHLDTFTLEERKSVYTTIWNKIEQYRYEILACENVQTANKTGLIAIMDYLKYVKNDGANKYVMMCLTHPRLKNAYCEGVCKGLEFAQEVAASVDSKPGVWICEHAFMGIPQDTSKYTENATPPVETTGGKRKYSQKRMMHSTPSRKYSQRRRYDDAQ